MTAIAGVEHGGRVWLGADSGMARPDGEVCLSKFAKVIARGGWVFGCAGDGRLDTLLRFHVDLPPVAGDVDELTHVALVAAIKKAATQRDIDVSECEALVGVRGRLYGLDCGTMSADRSWGYAAIGEGSGPALGVLFDRRGEDPRKTLARALRAAEQHVAIVRRPFRYVHT